MMKEIIISDVLGKLDSIIPYGLNLAKKLQVEVDVIHSIDSRSQQGVHSPYADSQTITPGSKLSHEEIIEREKNMTELALNRLLSREASRLNYPLKINTVVEENTILKSIQKSTRDWGKSIALINSQPDNYIFNSHNEILETINNIQSLVLFVPPGLNFKKIEKILLLSDFSTNDTITKLVDISLFLKKFDCSIDAVSVAKPQEYANHELMGKAWLQSVRKTVFPTSTVVTNVLTGNDYFNTLKEFLERSTHDLILFNFSGSGSFNGNLRKKLIKNLTSETKLPVLII